MTVARILRWVMMAVPLALLPGCGALDKEDQLRAELADWLYLAETRYFASKHNCTVAVFDVARAEVRTVVPRVSSVETALLRIEKGEPVFFRTQQSTPNEISQALMSKNLQKGVGMLTAGTGPTTGCMTDGIAAGYYRILTSDETLTIYDSAGEALLLIYPPELLAIFLRSSL